jgi:urocanate hydratase
LPSDSAPAYSDSMQLEAYGLYYALTQNSTDALGGNQGTETNLGGTLLYAGELDGHGRAMVIAGNVGGCGILAATADQAAQKQAIRDGVVDFLVSSLDEALRILKNEIRKRAAVAVCVGAAPADVEREMIERGVLPDLVFSGAPGEERCVPSFGVGSRKIQSAELGSGRACVSWQVIQSPARWSAKLDEIALDCLASDWRAQRWIRLSPRYCGRSVQARRALYCDSESAEQMITRFAAKVRAGEIETEVVASLLVGGETKEFRFLPVALG